MKFIKYLLFITLFVSSSFATMDPCSSANSAFENGEIINYKVYYNWGYLWLSAGEVIFSVSENEDEYIIEATGKTYPSYEWFFKVDDYFKTIIDKETLLPKVFERNVHEGKYIFYNKIEFDQKNRTAYSYQGKNSKDVVATELNFKSCVHDVLSSIYFLRNAKIDQTKNNQEIPIKVAIDADQYDIDVELQGVEEKKIKGLGHYSTIKISPALIAGNVFDENQRMNVWVSNDDNRIPLMIESPVSVGSIKAVLQSHSGLKHPLSSAL